MSIMPRPPQPETAARLAELTDQCVRCGLCLPHCPTYRLAANEAESPRGRIAMAQAMASDGFVPSPAAQLNLDHCLGCLSCEKVCPSQVQYEEILIASRSLLATRRRPALLERLLVDASALVRLARLAQGLRAWRWLPRLARVLPEGGLARRLAMAQLPAPTPMDAPDVGRRAPSRGRITLFRGCVASVHDRDTFAATHRLLTALGYEVTSTPAAACCGALAAHAGNVAEAAQHGGNVRARVAEAGSDTVLVTASGCLGTLRGQMQGRGTVHSAHRFIVQDSGFKELRFRPLAATAALHLPCTEINVDDGSDALRQLLGRISQLLVHELPLQPRCCGAAGSYFLQHPDMAQALRAQKLDQAAAFTPDLILTSNIGCRMHFKLGLDRLSPRPEVLHPLTLLARQLEYPHEE